MRVKIQACGTMIPPLLPLLRHTALLILSHRIGSAAAPRTPTTPPPPQRTSIFLRSPGTELAEQKFRYYGRVREYRGAQGSCSCARARRCAHVAMLSSLTRLGMRGLDACDELQGTCFTPLDTLTLMAFRTGCALGYVRAANVDAVCRGDAFAYVQQ